MAKKTKSDIVGTTTLAAITGKARPTHDAVTDARRNPPGDNRNGRARQKATGIFTHDPESQWKAGK